MASSLRRVLQWSKSHEGRKLIRFTGVSVVSTVVSVLVITLVYGLRIIRSEVEATLFGNIVAAIPSYTLNRRWTWGKTGRSHVRKEILPFATMTFLGIAFSIFWVLKLIVFNRIFRVDEIAEIDAELLREEAPPAN